MAQWVLVENNQVKEYHDLLPKNWGNYSGLNLSADDLPFLKSLGWYKVRKNPENYNPYTQRLTGYNYVIHENDVEEIPIIENMSEEEVTATDKVDITPTYGKYDNIEIVYFRALIILRF